MSTTRREFLAASAATAAGMSIYGAMADKALGAPEKEIAVKPALVVLYLRGGQDALNTVVPYTEGRYYDMRPNIAVPPPGQDRGALDLDGTFGFHPALTGFKTLWDKKLLAPIVNAGLGHPSRSHFRCQDMMEYGSFAKDVRSGWLNRFLTHTSPRGPEGEFRAVALQSRLPRSMRGAYPALAVAPSRARGRQQGRDGDVLELFDDLYKQPPSMEKPGMTMERPDEDDLTQSGRVTIDTLRKLEEILTTKPAGKEVAYPATAGRLGQQLKMAARILKSGQGVEVIGMDWNGWDHHINEGGVQDNDLINRMLGQLGTAFEVFYRDIDSMKNKVTSVVMTEFGRTNRENGNYGTDHGHGGAMFVMGGKVKGGKVYGDWTGLAPGRTYQNRDLLATTDWRTVLEEVVRDHLRLHPSKPMFPKWAPPEAKLGLFT